MKQDEMNSVCSCCGDDYGELADEIESFIWGLCPDCLDSRLRKTDLEELIAISISLD